MAIGLGWAVAVAVTAAIGTLFTGKQFAPNACDHFESYLTTNIVGQDLALRRISDAVCDHLANPKPQKPLVLSLHGPPGVGKSYFHLLAARALYSPRPRADLRCPGPDCSGYKILFGMDYTVDDRESQHAAVRGALFKHLRSSPQSFIIVEEYDKLDCTMRGFFRHLLEGGEVGNISLSNSIIVLESNLGYTTLHGMLETAGDRSKISPEDAQRQLKDLVFQQWRKEGCESRTDTLKMVSLVDFFLPFFPLERQHIRQLFALKLAERAAVVSAKKLGNLTWDTAVIDFLTGKVDFDGGPYPIEGGKEVGTLIVGYVARPMKEWATAQEERRKKDKEAPLPNGRLVVASGRRHLEVLPATTAADYDR